MNKGKYLKYFNAGAHYPVHYHSLLKGTGEMILTDNTLFFPFGILERQPNFANQFQAHTTWGKHNLILVNCDVRKSNSYLHYDH